MDGLQETLEEVVRERFAPDSEGACALDDGARSPVLLRARHVAHLQSAAASLRVFLLPHTPLDAAAEEMRGAIHHLGCITGRVDVEDILDELFKRFCVGK